MRVLVKLGMPLADLVGESKIGLELPEGATVADLLDELQARHPDLAAGLRGKGLPSPLDRLPYTLLVNTHPLPVERAGDRPLRDGDRVALFLPVVGG